MVKIQTATTNLTGVATGVAAAHWRRTCAGWIFATAMGLATAQRPLRSLGLGLGFLLPHRGRDQHLDGTLEMAALLIELGHDFLRDFVRRRPPRGGPAKCTGNTKTNHQRRCNLTTPPAAVRRAAH